MTGTTSHVLLENFQKLSITFLQVDIGCDAPEMGIVYTEGVLLGLVTCLTPIILHKVTRKLHRGKYSPSLCLATGNQLGSGDFVAGAVGENGGLWLCFSPHESLPRDDVGSQDLRRDIGMQ